MEPTEDSLTFKPLQMLLVMIVTLFLLYLAIITFRIKVNSVAELK